MRLLIVCLAVAAGYWYFFDMGSSSDGLSYEQQVLANRSAMAECKRKAAYAASRMAKSSVTAESDCARELGLYWEDGAWHSYKQNRR